MKNRLAKETKNEFKQFQKKLEKKLAKYKTAITIEYERPPDEGEFEKWFTTCFEQFGIDKIKFKYSVETGLEETVK